MTWMMRRLLSVGGLLSALSLLMTAGCDGGAESPKLGGDLSDASPETAGIDVIMDMETIPDVIPDLPPEQVDTQDDTADVSMEVSVDGELPGECGEDGDCPPTVGIETLADGAVVHGPVEIKVAAGDDDAVVKVRFLVDGGLLAEDAQVPYKVTWETAEFDDGPHDLEVIAFDTMDQTASARSR